MPKLSTARDAEDELVGVAEEKERLAPQVGLGGAAGQLFSGAVVRRSSTKWPRLTVGALCPAPTRLPGGGGQVAGAPAGEGAGRGAGAPLVAGLQHAMVVLELCSQLIACHGPRSTLTARPSPSAARLPPHSPPRPPPHLRRSVTACRPLPRSCRLRWRHCRRARRPARASCSRRWRLPPRRTGSSRSSWR